MPMRSPYRRSVKPPIIKWGNAATPFDQRSVCQLCGVPAPAIYLFEQRGIKVSKNHPGCVDDPDVYKGPLFRPTGF